MILTILLQQLNILFFLIVLCQSEILQVNTEPEDQWTLPLALTSLDNDGNASLAPAAADLSAHLLGGLLQLIRYTKCVLHLQAKQETRVVQAVKGSRWTKDVCILS